VAAVQYTFTHKQYSSSTVHIYTQTEHRTTKKIHRTTQKIHRTTKNKQYTEQHKNKLEQCGPCPVLVSYTLAFASQLRKKQYNHILIKIEPKDYKRIG
jgi:4-diphosphocytidyl-2C-methyl-D-erythritol kinase